MSEARFADMLKYLRRSRGYTQETLAEATGLSRTTIANYETGNRRPSYEILEMFADIFNVNMDTLLGNDDNFHLPEDTLSPSAKMLFMSLQGASDEEIEQAVKVINALRSK